MRDTRTCDNILEEKVLCCCALAEKVCTPCRLRLCMLIGLLVCFEVCAIIHRNSRLFRRFLQLFRISAEDLHLDPSTVHIHVHSPRLCLQSSLRLGYIFLYTFRVVDELYACHNFGCPKYSVLGRMSRVTIQHHHLFQLLPHD